MRLRKILLFGTVFGICSVRVHAFTGTTGAGFLELPIAARPTAMGGAYTALADDAYASTWNPAALAFLNHSEVSATQTLYVLDTSNSALTWAQRLGPLQGLGVSLHYFRPGNLTGRDANDNLTGSFTGYAGQATIAYGHRLTETLSAGLSIQGLKEKIDDVSGNTWAGGGGILFRPRPEWSFGAAFDHLGPALKLLSQEDDLPFTQRVGGSYTWNKLFVVSLEGAHKKASGMSGHLGLELRNEEGFSVRAGYNTESRRQLGGLSGLSAGVGMNIIGHEIAYAWLPLSDLGQAHLFSLVYRWGNHYVRESDDLNLYDSLSRREQEIMKDFSNP